MPSAFLENRAILRIAGLEARGFLQSLVTCDVDRIAPGQPGFGALLTPQGKIIVDFFLHEAADGAFLLDCPRDLAADLLRRLKLYRLRAKLELDDVSSQYGAAALWGDTPAPDGTIAGSDPRHAALGLRVLGEPARFAPGGSAAYAAHRIALGVPEGGLDFAYGDTFPHDANMDLLHGVDFRKGCYVGQEVVSRVEHRGTARKRILKARYDGPAPAPGTPLLTGEIEIGTTGSASGQDGLVLVRTDRLADAKAAGTAIKAAGLVVEIEAPAA